MEFRPENEAEVAGMALIQSNDFHFRLEYTLTAQQPIIRLIQCVKGVEVEVAAQPFSADRIYLKVVADGQDYRFYFGTHETTTEILAENVDGRILSTDVVGWLCRYLSWNFHQQ